jgi:DNA repair photolyase
LLREGYPICISNRTDPFSKVNYVETISLVQNLQLLPNRIFFQTKGTHGVDDVLDILGDKKCVFYITTSFLNDNLRKIVEPNAASVEERLKLAEKLKKRGHCVIFALNPYVPEWISDKEVEELAKIALGMGIKSIVLEALHMNKLDIQKLLPHEANAFQKTGVNLYEYSSRSFNIEKRVIDTYFLLKELGLYPLKTGMPMATRFYDEVNETLVKFYPNASMFLDYAAKKFGSNEGVLTVEDYVAALSKGNENFFSRELKMLDAYIATSNINVWANNPEAQGVKTMADVLRIFYNDRRLKQSPQHNWLFNPIDHDEAGNLLLKYDGGRIFDRAKQHKG